MKFVEQKFNIGHPRGHFVDLPKILNHNLTKQLGPHNIQELTKVQFTKLNCLNTAAGFFPDLSDGGGETALIKEGLLLLWIYSFT